MINRILTRLLKIPNRVVIRSFSSFDDSNKGGRGGAKFFGRKDKGKEVGVEPQKEEDRKQTHHKTVKFMKKHELKMKELQGQPKKELRFRKKDGFEQAEAEKPSPFVRPLGEENEEEEIKKSIFFAKGATPTSEQPQTTPKSFSLPQLNQFLSSPGPESKFYDKLSHDLDNILLMFSRRSWKELSDFIQKAYSSVPAADIEKELHSLLIATDASSYVQWIRSKGRNYKDLSERTLGKLYSHLLRQQKHSELKELLGYFSEKGFNVEYRSADTILFDLKKDAVLRGLEQQLTPKIDLIISIFKVQKTFFLSQAEKNIPYEEVQCLGEWFSTLAYLALDRKIATRKFLALFDEIFSNHWSYISNEGVYGSGLFLRIISEHYFGTHISTEKLKQLFSGLIVQDNFLAKLVLFRNAMAEYKRRTGKAPFPNAKNILAQFNNAFEAEDQYQCLFFFTLLNYNDQPIDDLNLLLEKREILLAVNGVNLSGKEVLNDLLFKLTPQELASRPLAPGEAEERERKRQEKAEKALKFEMQQQEISGQEQFGKIGEMVEDPLLNFKEGQHEQEGQEQFSDDSQHYSWGLYEPIPDQKIYGAMDAQYMGWSVSQYNNIYTYLSQQAAVEGNPYRKELLQNILRAKLNANKCRIVEITPEEQIEAMFGGEVKEDKAIQVPTQQEIEQFKIERDALMEELMQKDPQEEEEEDDAQYLAQQKEYLFKQFDNPFTNQNYKEEEQESEDTSQVEMIYDANEFHRPTIDFNNTLAVKSAIKLDKLELAYGICQKTVMEPLILERVRKDIVYVVKAYLVEENSKMPIPDLPNILQSVQNSVLKLSDEFLRSVYDRCDSFDELIWGYTPPKQYKFDFWRATLALDRGHELIKMDISNKLKDMKYQPEYDTLPYRERDGYIKEKPTTWRAHLMSELGIVKPAKIMDYEPGVISIKSDEEFYGNFIHDQIYEDVDVEALQVEHGLRTTELAAEGTEAVEEGAEEVAEEGAQASEAVENGEAAEEAEVEAAAEEAEPTEAVEGTEAIQGEKSAELTAQELEEQAQGQGLLDDLQKQDNPYQPRLTIKVDPNLFKEQQPNHQQQQSDDKNLDPILGIYSNFDPTATTRIRGFDFTNFLTLAKTQIRPDAQKQYQQEKQLKKFMINLESLCQESWVEDVHYLQRKLHAYQKSVKSLTNIKLLLDFGIWNFQFAETCIDPELARTAAQNFRELFYKFKTYNGAKGYGDVNEFSNERFVDIAERAEFITELKFTEEMVEDLLIRRFRLFKDAEAANKLQPSKEVQELMAWGLRHDQPMAIYLGEKIAMLTNQLIPHNLAKQVGDYLSHRRDVPSERIERCKECLKIVGRVNRQHIYDFNKEYPHITVRKHFQQYLSKRREELNSTSLEFLSRVDPTHSHQPEPHVLRSNLKRSHMVV